MMPSLNFPRFISVFCTATSVLGSVFQSPHNVHQVAIIGAGAAGSSTAYYLREEATRLGLSINITVFEKTDRIGGRTLTINPWDDPAQRVELGASIFIQKNTILYESLDKFNLSPKIPDEDSDGVIGIWDGEEFVFTVDESDSYWWMALKVIWKYGLFAPRRTQKLVASTIDKFLKLYDAPAFPFRSLTQRVYELGLIEATGVTGQQWLKQNSISDLYAHDIVQAATRVNYASNLARIHGLDTMVAMAPEGAMAVKDGNWQIFSHMVNVSGAVLFLETPVVGIEFASQDEESGTSSRPRYSIQTKSLDSSISDVETNPITFDHVIIASPYQFTDIKAAEGVIQRPIDEVPYVQLHVTIFASPFEYSPSFFNLSNTSDVPSTILTTLGKGDDASSGVNGAGKAGFFSISKLRTAVNPKTRNYENIYKVFSPEKISPDFLSRLLGVKVPDDFTGEEDHSDAVSPISWYYPHVFYSYPQALPRVTFEDPVVGPWVYYTSGMEGFISTMETNALMGKNVAHLVVQDIQEAAGEGDDGNAGQIEMLAGSGASQDQKPLH